VREDDEIALISSEGMVLRTLVKQVPQMGRATRGAIVMRMREGDIVAALALLTPKELKQPAETS